MAEARHRTRPRRGAADQTNPSRGGGTPATSNVARGGHRLLDERGVQVGYVDMTDMRPAFGHLEPTVLLHREAADRTDTPRGAYPKRPRPRNEADREDGTQ